MPVQSVRTDLEAVKVKGAQQQSASNPGASGSAAIGVPENFAAGQQYAGNPLAPLLNAQNAGALAGFNPFAAAGINANDPNYINNMMNDPQVQAQMNQMLSDPAVVEQMIQASPELRAMGPQVRAMMQSEQFRSFLTNPDAMRQAAQMSQMFRGMGGAGPGMGAMGGGQQQQQQQPNLFNPWAQTPSTGTGAGAATATTTTGSTTSSPSSEAPAAAAPFNPFGMFGGGAPGAQGGQQPDFNQMMQQLQQMQQMTGGAPFGGAGGGAATSQPQVPPEERYQVQLEQLANMGFSDPARNIRALMASGGNVEGAIEWMFSNTS